VCSKLGPLLIHPLFYHFPRFWYGEDVQHSALQKSAFEFIFFVLGVEAYGIVSRYVYTFVMLHFLKRELETLL
jgi:very-long-chain enoyl-CoA reductase